MAVTGTASARAEWDAAYAEGHRGCSWYQERPVMSLRMLHAAGVTSAASVVDVGGGASTLVDAAAASGFTDLTVLDLSERALELARARLRPDVAARVRWLAADLLSWAPERTYDVWHDRAVLHFLVDDEARARYLDVLHGATAPGSTAVFACFAPDGPQTCSGLPVRRSSVAELRALLGAGWTLLAHDRELHRTPRGASQPFTWAAFRRCEPAAGPVGVIDRAAGRSHTDRRNPSVTTILPITPDQAPLLARPYFSAGDPGPIAATLAHVPELLGPALSFLGPVLAPSGLSFRTKEIVIVRTSAVAGCRYCVQSHSTVALDAGLSVEQVRALQDTRGSADALFPDPREVALLRWVDLVAGSGPVVAQERAAVLAHWSDYEVVELTTVVGATLLLNRFATALALPTSPDVLTRLTTEGLL